MKSAAVVSVGDRGSVAPYAGAGIEIIIWTPEDFRQLQVAPYAGAGIEISSGYNGDDDLR